MYQQIVFNLHLAVGHEVDRLALLTATYFPNVRLAEELRLGLIQASEDLELACADLDDAQAAIDDWYERFAAAQAQVELDRMTLRLAADAEPNRTERQRLWIRQNQREIKAREAAYVRFFELEESRRACKAQLEADLSTASAALAKIRGTIAAFTVESEQYQRTLALRDARLAREAALAAQPAKKHSRDHVEQVLAATHKADRALKVAQ